MLLHSLSSLFHPGKPAAQLSSEVLPAINDETWKISSRQIVFDKPRLQPAALTPMAVLQTNRAVPISCSIEDHCRQLISQQQLEDTFYVVDFSTLLALKQDWDARCAGKPSMSCMAV